MPHDSRATLPALPYVSSAAAFLAGLCAAAAAVSLPLLVFLYARGAETSPFGTAIAAILDALFRVRDFTHATSAEALRFALRKVASRVVVASLGVCVAGVAVVRFRAAWDAIRRRFVAEGHAANLAVFRIVFFSSLTYGVSLDRLVALCRLSPSLVTPPFGMGAILAVFPPTEAGITALWAAFQVARAFAVLGIFSRLSAFVTGLLAIFVLGVAGYYGKVDHDGHHIVWLAWLLAATRCGDALSVDCLLRRGRSGERAPFLGARGIDYGRSMTLVWLALAAIYFFPGFWKLWEGGLDWIFSDNLLFTMYRRWWIARSLPLLRFDAFPALLRVGALAVVVFELGFVVAVFSERARPAFAAAGLLFHLLAWLALDIRFARLVVCYVAFVDWRGLAARLRSKPPTVPPHARPRGARIAVAVGLSLLLVEGYHGLVARRYAAWPFGTFPTFEAVERAPSVATISIAATDAAGRPIPIDAAVARLTRILGRERWLHHTERLLETSSATERERVLLNLWDGLEALEKPLAHATTIAAYREVHATLPEAWDAPPTERELLARVPRPTAARSD